MHLDTSNQLVGFQPQSIRGVGAEPSVGGVGGEAFREMGGIWRQSPPNTKKNCKIMDEMFFNKHVHEKLIIN